jgi:putative ABC transport system permease protein
MLFTRIILRPMRAQRLRTAVTVLGVALGVAVMLAIQLANTASLRGFSTALDAVSGRAALEITAPPTGLDETKLPELTWLREFGVATPVIESEVLAETASGAEMLKVIGIDPLRDPALRDYALADGDGAAAGMALMSLLSEPKTLILTRGAARRLGVEEDAKLRLVIGDQTHECRVAALAGGGDSRGFADQPLAVMDIGHAQALFRREGRVDRLEVRLHEEVAVEAAEPKVRERMPAGWRVQRPQRRTEAVEKMLAAFHFNLTMLSGIALVVGLFLIYNTVSVSVMTRRPEIGMLRTLGVTRRSIVTLFVGEALALSVAGALVGVPLAKLLATGAVALTSTTVNTLYVARAAAVPELTAAHWLAALVIALPLALVAAARPAMEAARVAPVAAIANAEAGKLVAATSKNLVRRAAPLILLAAGIGCALQPPVFELPLWGYAAALCAVLAAALAVPGTLSGMAQMLRPALGRFGIEGRLAAAQIAASSRRLSVSVAALAVSLALTVAIAVMVGSFRQTVVHWVDQTMGADLYIRPAAQFNGANPPPLSPNTIAVLKQHPQVSLTEGYRSLELPFRDRSIRLGVSDFETLIQRGRVLLKTPGDAAEILRAARAAGEVVVSESFALRFKVGKGDTIELEMPKGPQPLRIAAVTYDYTNDRGTLTMDEAQFAQLFGHQPPTHMAVYLRPGADAETVRSEILRNLGASVRLVIFTNAGLRAEVLKIFDSTFAITWALEIIAVLVAMAGVAATMLTLVLERRQELCLLRLAGADARQVRRTIVIESGLLGLVSQALGIVVGILLSLVLIHVINPQSFGWSMRLYLPWWFLIGSTVLTLIGTMLAGLYPAWWVTRQHLATQTS